MKQLAFSLMLLAAFSIQALAQLQVEKVPGEQVTISWTFAQADESLITGFKVLSCDTSDGNYTEFQTVPATVREINFPAASSPKFYKVVTYKSNLVEQQSPSNYVVLVNIRLKGVVGVALR